MSEWVSYLAARYLTWLECRSMAVRLGLASHSSDAAASPTPHLQGGEEGGEGGGERGGEGCGEGGGEGVVKGGRAALADAQLAQPRATEGAHLRSSEGLQGGGKSVARGRQGVSKEL